MKVVRESLSQNDFKIKKWMNSNEYRLELPCDHPDSLGFGVKPNSLTKIDDVHKDSKLVSKLLLVL